MNVRYAATAVAIVLCVMVLYCGYKETTTSKTEDWRQLSTHKSIGKNLQSSDNVGGFHLMVMLSIFNGQHWSHYGNFSQKKLQERDDEVIETLQTNANNGIIKEIHLFYDDEVCLKTLKDRNLTNGEKITPVKLNRKLHMADFFLYASNKLIDKPAIATNADIIIGEGFDKVDTVRLRDEKVLYSLSRHPANNAACNGPDLCDNYYAMIYVMKFDFGFLIHNPCHDLFTYHKHCSRVHGSVGDSTYSTINLPGRPWTHRQLIRGGMIYPRSGLVY